MSKKIRILLADADQSFCSELSKAIAKAPNMELLAFTHSGKDAISLAKKLSPDVLITELSLPFADGFAILDAVKPLPVHTLVVSAFLHSGICEALASRGADFYLPKPCRPDTVIERIQLLSDIFSNTLPKKNETESLITDMLQEVGVPAHIMGYYYIRSAVSLVYQDISMVSAVTKVLYPEVAHYYNTTPSRVERAIRHAIEKTWIRGNFDAHQKYFGYSFSTVRKKPTNSEFISALADRLRMQ